MWQGKIYIKQPNGEPVLVFDPTAKTLFRDSEIKVPVPSLTDPETESHFRVGLEQIVAKQCGKKVCMAEVSLSADHGEDPEVRVLKGAFAICREAGCQFPATPPNDSGPEGLGDREPRNPKPDAPLELSEMQTIQI